VTTVLFVAAESTSSPLAAFTLHKAPASNLSITTKPFSALPKQKLREILA
jgi:hypothetical protein